MQEQDRKLASLSDTESVLTENCRTLNAIRGRLRELDNRLFGSEPVGVEAPDAPRAMGALDRLRDIGDLQTRQLQEILATLSKLEQGLETSPNIPSTEVNVNAVLGGAVGGEALR